ncbi:MBL fold metallo-hydrolase [Thermodesulfobacteriota bacterium]
MFTIKGCLTILTDNVVPGKSTAIGEHGFCIFVETDNGNFLFDTGRGKTIIHNAHVYNKNLNVINKIVLSHNHGDHTGGIQEVLFGVRHKPIDVYAHEDLFLPRFKREKDTDEYQGIPFTRGHLERLGAHFVFNRAFAEIEAGIFLTGEVPRQTLFEKADMENRFMVLNGEKVPDTIEDDQSMVVHTEKGLLLVLGCAHAGIINVVNYVLEKTGIQDIFAIIGGTHIGFSGEVQLNESIAALKTYNIQHLIPSHCTGPLAIARMKQEFDDIFQFSHVGFCLEF